MKGVQCYELFGGIALKIHTFSFSFFIYVLSLSAIIDSLSIIHHSFADNNGYFLVLFLRRAHSPFNNNKKTTTV